MNKIERFVKERNRVVLEGDLAKFETFVAGMMRKGLMDQDVYEKFRSASVITKKATMEKMVCNITTMPEERKRQAREWLAQHNMSENIYPSAKPFDSRQKGD